MSVAAEIAEMLALVDGARRLNDSLLDVPADREARDVVADVTAMLTVVVRRLRLLRSVLVGDERADGLLTSKNAVTKRLRHLHRSDALLAVTGEARQGAR